MTIFPKSMQSVLQSSGRAPGAMGSKFSHIFLREVSLGEKLYFGGKMICCNFFLTNKELMDRKTKRHKDKHRNNCESCQSQVTWKLEFKCQFPLSCLSIIICTTCNFLFIRCWSDTLQLTSFRAEITFPFSSSYGNPWSSNRYQWVVVVSRIAIIGIKGKVAFTLNEVDRGLSDHNFKKMNTHRLYRWCFQNLKSFFLLLGILEFRGGTMG